jgi:acyl carrier protein
MELLYENFIDLIQIQIQNGTFPEHLQKMTLQKETHLNELGLDSISLVTLLTSLMYKINKELPALKIMDDF